MNSNKGSLEKYFQDKHTGISVVDVDSIEYREPTSSCIILLKKNDVGMLIWPAWESVVSTRWYIKVSSCDDQYTVLCLCGCHLPKAQIKRLDNFLQEAGISTALVRTVACYGKTRFIEAGSPEGISLVKDWPINVFDRHPERPFDK
jgi:hypothetical protein